MTKSRARWIAVYCVAILVAGIAAFGNITAIAQTAPQRFEGILTVIWGDPAPGHSGGATYFNITLPDGTTYQLDINSAQQTGAVQYFGKQVAIAGRLNRNASATGPGRISVDRLEPVESAVPVQPRVPTIRRVLFLLLRFKGDAQQPNTPQFFKDLSNPKISVNATIPATINGFFNKTSWGKLQWKADVGGVGGLNPTTWLTLPKSKTGYANCGWSSACANIMTLAKDAMDMAVAAGINVTVYDNINFVLNNDLDCCAWGGGFFYNAKLYGATWEPPWGQETGVYSHEMGHSLGLPHSGWVYHAYDSPWDMLSSVSGVNYKQCGSYNSANSAGANTLLYCSEPGDGYITPHKDHVGWIPAANQVVINSVTTQTVNLEADALPLGAGIKMIKICLAGVSCTGSAAHYITVETRLKNWQFDRGLTFGGVIIHDVQMNRAPIGGHCYFNSQSGWAVPMDATKNDYDSTNCTAPAGKSWPNYALGNAEYRPGRKYRNLALGVTIEVVSYNTTTHTYSVKVTRSK